MIQITNTISIHEREIKLEFIKSSGPGGQNINKVATAVKLKFDVVHSPSLPDDVRQRLLSLYRKRLKAKRQRSEIKRLRSRILYLDE